MKPFIIAIVIIILYIITREIISRIRSNRITKNSLKNSKKNNNNVLTNQTQNKSIDSKELDETIDTFVKLIGDQSVDSALKEIIKKAKSGLKKEIELIQNELKLGIDLNKTFERLYKKTKNQNAKTLYQLLYLYDKKMISKKEIFAYYNDLKKNNMNNNLKTKYTNNNKIIAKILSYFSFVIVSITFSLAITQITEINLLKWIEFLIVVILVYLVYFEINNYYTKNEYKKVKELHEEETILSYIRIFHKKLTSINEAIVITETIENRRLSNKEKIIYKKNWQDIDKKEKIIKEKIQRKVSNELKKIPYKLGINWTICTTLVLIAIIYLVK